MCRISLCDALVCLPVFLLLSCVCFDGVYPALMLVLQMRSAHTDMCAALVCVPHWDMCCTSFCAALVLLLHMRLCYSTVLYIDLICVAMVYVH